MNPDRPPRTIPQFSQPFLSSAPPPQVPPRRAPSRNPERHRDPLESSISPAPSSPATYLDSDRRRSSTSTSMTADSGSHSTHSTGIITPRSSADPIVDEIDSARFDRLHLAESATQRKSKSVRVPPSISPRRSSIMSNHLGDSDPATQPSSLDRQESNQSLGQTSNTVTRKPSDRSITTWTSRDSGQDGSQTYKTARQVREEELEKKRKEMVSLKHREIVVGGVPKKASSTGVYTPPTFPGASGPRPSAYPSNVYTPSSFSGPSTPRTPTSAAPTRSSYFPTPDAPPPVPNSAEQYSELKRQKYLGARLSGLTSAWSAVGNAQGQGRASLDERRLEASVSETVRPVIPEGPRTAPLPASTFSRFRQVTSPLLPLSGGGRPEFSRSVSDVSPSIEAVVRERVVTSSETRFERAQSGYGLGLGIDAVAPLLRQVSSNTMAGPSSVDSAENRTRNVKNLSLAQPSSTPNPMNSPVIVEAEATTAPSPPIPASEPVPRTVRRKAPPKVRESMFFAEAPVILPAGRREGDGRQRILECDEPLEQ